MDAFECLLVRQSGSINLNAVSDGVFKKMLWRNDISRKKDTQKVVLL